MPNENLNILINAKDNATGELNKVQSRFQGFKESLSAGWVTLASKVYLFQQALRTVGAVIGPVIRAAQESEDSIKRLNIALSIQGTLTEEVSKRFQAYAQELQKSTRYGDEAIQDVMQTLIAIGNVSTDELPRATKAVLDFASATGRDLDSAAMAVAKAAAGFTGELARYGIILDENIPKSEKFAMTLRFIEQRFGGTAKKDVETYSGAVDQLKNAWGDLLEELGKFVTTSPEIQKGIKETTGLIGLMTTAAKDLMTIISKPENRTAMQKFFAAGISGMAQMAFPLLKLYQTIFGPVVKKMTESVNLSPVVVTPKAIQAATEENPPVKKSNEITKGITQGMDTLIKEYGGLAGSVERTTVKMAGALENSMATLFFDPVTRKFGNLKNIAEDFGVQVLSILSHMAAQWALFGFSGSGGLLGSFGLKGFATGTAYVPQTGVYMLHRGEKVVPEHEARRGGLSGGSSVVVNMNVQSWDTQDIMRNRKGLAAAIAEEIRANSELRGVMKNYT